jgi:Fanconi-associated nuclease 1
MLGEQIKHPPSTNFHAGGDVRPAKRLKRVESGEGLCPSTTSDDCVVEPGDDDTLLLELGQPNLEAALPIVSIDEEAIKEYEVARAADIRRRLGEQEWTRGKTSIYVDAFNLALETVLEDEGPLFNLAELAVFENWRQLDYEAQYL